MGRQSCIAAARVAETNVDERCSLRKGAEPPLTRYIFIDSRSLPGARVHVELHRAGKLPAALPDYEIPHIHEADEFHFFIGDGPDLSGLEGEIRLEGKAWRASSPAAVYVPSGTAHAYKVIRGQGSVVVLLRRPDYACTAKEPDPEKGEKESQKFSRYILTSDIRPTSELRFHHDTAPGERHVMIDGKKLDQADFYTIVRSARNVQATQPNYVDQHRHRCDTYHLFIGNRSDLTGLRAEMVMAGQKSAVESPAAVYVPEGVPHCYRLTGGSGRFFNIVPMGTYDDSLM